MTSFFTIILHIDTLIPYIFQCYGEWIFAWVFIIIFCETGIIFLPFLPGDSLLFAIGGLVGKMGGIPIEALAIGLTVAAILGDIVNYTIGYFLGETLIRKGWVLYRHIEKSRAYFDKNGTKSILLARFIPIIRTCIPFLAGFSHMNYKKFMTYNVIGGVLWVHFFLLAGYFFSQISFIQTHFSTLILGIISISFIPMILEATFFLRKKKA